MMLFSVVLAATVSDVLLASNETSSARAEGPEVPPVVERLWPSLPRVRHPPAPLELRRRRTRDAMIGLSAVTAASLVSMGIFLGLDGHRELEPVHINRGINVSGTLAVASALALVGSGIGLAVLGREGRQGWPRGDPRINPEWARKDRALTRHLGAWSTMLGLSAVGLFVCGGMLFFGDGEDATGPGACAASFAGFTGLFAAPTIGVALGRRHHRTPLRGHAFGLHAGGLSVRF